MINKPLIIEYQFKNLYLVLKHMQNKLNWKWKYFDI